MNGPLWRSYCTAAAATLPCMHTFQPERGLGSNRKFQCMQACSSLTQSHLTEPLRSYADLARAGAANTPLPTELPGATLRAQPVNATTVRSGRAAGWLPCL